MFKPLTSMPVKRKIVVSFALQARDGAFAGCVFRDKTGSKIFTSRKASCAEVSSRKRRGSVFIAYGLDDWCAAVFGRGIPDGTQLAISPGVGVITGRIRDGQPTKTGKRRVTRRLWDLARHYRGDCWSELASMVGVELVEWCRPKSWLPRPRTEDSEELRRVLLNRAEILWLATTQLEELYLESGTELGPTAASSALRNWRRVDLPNARWPMWIPPEPYKLRWMRPALFGTRTEILRTGVIEGPLESWDINSAHPAIAAEAMLPCVSDPWTRIVETPRRWRERPSIVEATVRVPEMLIPPLPWRRADGKIIYPTGQIRGRWQGCELAYAESIGTEILEIHSGMVFTGSAPYLREYVERWWKRKVEASSDLERAHAKMMLITPLGKFGQRPQRSEIISPDEKETWLAKHQGEWARAMVAGEEYTPPILHAWPSVEHTVMLVHREDATMAPPPQHVNVFWTAEIYAQNRIKLHKAVTMQPFVHSYDSDQILGGVDPVGIDRGEGLGQWGLQAEWEEIVIRAPKQYTGTKRGGERSIVVAGIADKSAGARYVDQGHASWYRDAGWLEQISRPVTPGAEVLDGRRARRSYDRRQWSDIENCYVPWHVLEGTDRSVMEERSTR